MAYDSSILSDLHKDARGFRPGEGFWSRWNASTENEKQAIWDGLSSELDREMDREERALVAAKMKWEGHIAEMMKQFGIRFADAVRWDMDAMNVMGDFGYYLWQWGICSFSYEREIKMKLGMNGGN